MMDAELKRKWVEALRSGKYKQGMGQLKGGDSYCCLGVLCDVAAVPISFDGFHTLINGAPSSYDALEAFGLDEDQECKLFRMNDGGKPFSDIADYIEANL